MIFGTGDGFSFQLQNLDASLSHQAAMTTDHLSNWQHLSHSCTPFQKHPADHTIFSTRTWTSYICKVQMQANCSNHLRNSRELTWAHWGDLEPFAARNLLFTLWDTISYALSQRASSRSLSFVYFYKNPPTHHNIKREKIIYLLFSCLGYFLP